MLTIAFNVFDGEELLEESIRGVRDIASRIVFVWQRVSNCGEEYEPALPGGFDAIEFCPDLSRPAHVNELAKRNLAVGACRTPWFMSMDVDELYKPGELARAFAATVGEGCDAAACQMQTYYGTPNWRLDPPETYWVPLFYPMNGRRFEHGCRWPVPVDPTRSMPAERVRLFTRTEIEMHHMSYVRRDIRRKLRNSSARPHLDLERLASWHENWRPGTPALMPRGEHAVTHDETWAPLGPLAVEDTARRTTGFEGR